MKIQEAPLPSHIEALLPDLRVQITEYLDLEEDGFNPRDTKYKSYFRVDDSVAFVVFDYATDQWPAAGGQDSPFAFFQYSLAKGMQDSGCIGCWPRTKGETLAWSIAEFLEANPIDNS